jgi:hypothetical protein
MSTSFTQFNTHPTDPPGTVSIYVRNYKKHAIILQVRSPITGLELHQQIKNKYLSHITEFVLCSKGKAI